MEHPIRVPSGWLQQARLLLLAFLLSLYCGAAAAQPFDLQAENARYRQWLADFRADLLRLRQSPDPAAADIDSLFTRTIVPGSRATQLVKTESLRAESTFGDIMRGLLVYGRAVLQPTLIAEGVVVKGP